MAALNEALKRKALADIGGQRELKANLEDARRVQTVISPLKEIVAFSGLNSPIPGKSCRKFKHRLEFTSSHSSSLSTPLHMESTDKKILVPIDDDPSTTKAVSVAVNRAKSWMNAGLSVSMVLINLYSAFDVIGRQENDGKLAMDQAESFVSASGVRLGPSLKSSVVLGTRSPSSAS